jgi:SAM-dependent methyltransferase
MALAVKALFNNKKLALTRARFRAWWEGEEFDETSALAVIEGQLSEQAANDASVESELFDAPPYELPARLQALAALWGEGRVRPGDATMEALEPARLGIAPDGVLAMLGPGLAAPVVALADAYAGRIDVFEWREETLDALTHGVAKANLNDRINVARIDLEAHVFTPAAFDGLLSIDDFAYCSYPPHLAQQIMKALKPGACAVVETYVGLRGEELATAFASSFAEPQIRAHGDLLQFFADAGFALELDEDLTDEFLAAARAAFKALGESLTQGAGLEPAAGRELAWEAEAWRMRLKLLAQRRLERRRFILRKPSDAQDANAKAPAD